MDVNRAVYLVLTLGMLVSLLLYIAGFLMYFAHLDIYMQVLVVATLTLLFTPPARVLVAFMAFASNREVSNALVSLAVFSIMLLSILVGIVFHVHVR